MAANPVQYALNNISKKAQELFNPVGQAISRVPQQFGNYLQQSAPVQGVQMYQRAFQSPQVQRQAINFGQNIYKAVNSPYEAVNRQMAPVLQKTKNMPLLQRIDTVLPQAAKSFSSNLLPGYVPNVVNPTIDLGYNAVKSMAKLKLSPEVKKAYGIKDFRVEDVGNLAGGVGAIDIPGNIIGGGIGAGFQVGSNVLSGKQWNKDLEKSFDEGYKFTAKLGPLGKLAETPLKPLLSKINPETVNTVNSLVSQKLYKEAAKLLVRKATASGVSGGVGFGTYNLTMPAKDLEERVKNVLEGVGTGFAFGAGTSIGGDILGTGFSQMQGIYKNKPRVGVQDTNLNVNGKPSNRYTAPLRDSFLSVRENPDVTNPAWNKVHEFARRELTPSEYKTYMNAKSSVKLGYLNRIETRFGNELKGLHQDQAMQTAESSVKLPTQEGLVKEQQFKKISVENPMTDSYHTGIRSPSDIKTFRETLSDTESFVNPDFTKEMAKKALKNGEITIYSSKPLDKSVSQFVTPSKMMASDYAGNGKVYSRKVNLNEIAWISGDEGNFVGKSQLTDIFNQSKGVQNADLSIKLPEAPVAPELKVVNGKVKVKMKPISAPTLETPESLSSNQELAGSGAGGGSSIKNTQEIVNPQDPYFNVKRLNIDPKKQQAVKLAIEEAKPQFEEVVGKKLSNKEVVDFSNQSAKVLNKAVNREQTKQWSASMLKAREQLAKSAQDDKLTPEFLETLINVKSQGADIARKLQSLSINADPKTVTAKQAILEAVLKVTNNSDDILKAAKGVDFNDQEQATAFYRQFVKPKAEDWLTLVRYNSMLSSPNTHLVNTSSNFQGTGIVAPVEKTILGGIDWMRSKATGTKRRYYAGEGVEYAKGYYSNLNEASKNFIRVMRGESLSGNPDVRQLPLTTKKGLARTTEHVLNYPMRLLEGMDQFFSTLTSGGVERSLAYRQGKGVRVGNIEFQAQQEAANRLFRGDVGGKDQGTLLRAIDQVTNLVFRARSNENPIVRNIAQFTFPFVKTPMNVVKQMVEYSPAGILTLPGAKFKQEQLAKAIMGAGVALGASQLLSSDRLTWAEPTSEKQRNAFRAAGLQPYAIKIGDKWVSYAKLHPVIGFNLAMVSALNDAFKNKKLSESEVETALTGLSKWWGYFADQSYIKNMGDLVASARGDLSGTARMLSNYPTQVIPYRALMSWVERIVDPYQRQADPDGSMLQKQLQLIGSQIPGIAGNVPTRKNIYGEPIENQNRILNALSPARVTTENPEQKQIYDNMVEKSILTKQIKDIKDQVRQGKTVTGNTSSIDMGSEDVMKARFQVSGDGAWNLGGKLYIRTDSGGVKVVDLQKATSGNAIQQAKQSANSESQIKSTGVNAYFSTKLSDLDKNTIYKALGTNASDVEMKALASLPDDKQASVLYGLLKDRKWKQEKVDAFIKSDVLTNSVVGKMEDQGLINSDQASQLKAYIKSTSIKLGKVSAGKKAKKIKMPKLKAIKVKYSKLKIKIPKPKKYKSLLSTGKSNKYFK